MRLLDTIAKGRLFSAGVVLMFIGGFFITLEAVFYNGVGPNGVLQESLFLPVGAFSLVVGVGLLLLTFFNMACNKYARRLK